jgi:hypothetical protein
MLNNIAELKNNMKQNVIRLKSFDDADGLLYCYIEGKCIEFDSIILKNYFINNTQRPIINCNSSYDKFLEEMENFSEISIFNNVNACNDFTILDIVNKTNNLKIW